METRILLVDDHAVVRSGMRNAFREMEGVRIVGEADTGVGIEREIEQTGANCLLIDVTMPNFDPIVSVRGIRRLYPELKILVVSAYDDNFYVQGLLNAGANGYHLKDQPLSDLRLAVERVMRGERWVTGRLLDKLLAPAAVVSNPDEPKLTERQSEILRLLQKGYDNQRIARTIGISVKTVENHLTRLYRVLGVQSRLEAANYGRALTQVDAVEPVVSIREKPLILIVDDNARFRGQLGKSVKRVAPGAVIMEAEGGDSAESLARKHDFQLIFVDVVLGNEDGISCVARLRPILPNARIILITAYPDREFHRRGLEAGASALLDKKNLDSTVLAQILQDTINR